MLAKVVNAEKDAFCMRVIPAFWFSNHTFVPSVNREFTRLKGNAELEVVNTLKVLPFHLQSPLLVAIQTSLFASTAKALMVSLGSGELEVEKLLKTPLVKIENPCIRQHTPCCCVQNGF